ncbi:hypothetical protein [Sinorhizobium meliloti]|uniref:hypothetical protein n=1 Tax=Rhizobium meliloti TaxID=382 RepID=UPI001911E706|nr:hypothetical protein [Sinorhizobium meliloti]
MALTKQASANPSRFSRSAILCLKLKFPLTFRQCVDLVKAPGIVKLQGVCIAYGTALLAFHFQRIAPSFGIRVRPVLSGCYPGQGLSLSISRERLGDQVGLAVRSAPGSLASRADAFDDDNHHVPLGCRTDHTKTNAFIRNAAMSVWRDAAEGTWQLSGPKQTKLLAQFFPIAVSGDDELMIDASRCPERFV